MTAWFFVAQIYGKEVFLFSINKFLPIEHQSDGTLFRMTTKQRKRANALIRKSCCNYSGGNCLWLDRGRECICVQSISHSIICKWFRHAILPQDASLEAGVFSIGKAKHCAVCGALFRPKSNRGKYCTACAKHIHRKQKAASERKRRANVDK